MKIFIIINGYNTITQNSAGDIMFDVNNDIIDIFVSNTNYSRKDWMIVNPSHGLQKGLHYMGSIEL